MRILIDFLYLLAAAAFAPAALYRLIRHNRYRAGWPQRLGRIARKAPAKKCIWLHAVSVGEVNAAQTVVNELAAKFGDFEIVVSTGTDTGFARATAAFGEEFGVFYFPFDFSWIMSRAFRNIRPSLCLLMELEVWPNFVRIAKKAGIPVVVVNGRISDRSFKSYSRVRPLIKSMFSKVALVLAQTEEYARRFRHLGCNNVIVSGSLKYDTAQTADKVEGADLLAKQLGLQYPPVPPSPHTNETNNSRSNAQTPGGEPIINIEDPAAIGRNQSSIINSKSPPLWVLGGTGNDEEALLLDVYEQLKADSRFADLRLAVVPRKPERFEEVAQLIKSRGHDLIRYSQIKTAPPPDHTSPDHKGGGKSPGSASDPKSIINIEDPAAISLPTNEKQTPDVEKIVNPIILGDTMGDLRKFYSLATIIFVGRSLVPMGGSDMMEAAALGKCTIFGPHAFNFKQAVDALLAEQGAIMAKNKEDLLQIMKKCLSDHAYAQKTAQNGKKVILKNQGATKKTIDQIAKLLLPPTQTVY
jgi:3-deoxy-D-manno-octulosonic-acid transferase